MVINRKRTPHMARDYRFWAIKVRAGEHRNQLRESCSSLTAVSHEKQPKTVFSCCQWSDEANEHDKHPRKKFLSFFLSVFFYQDLQKDQAKKMERCRWPESMITRVYPLCLAMADLLPEQRESIAHRPGRAWKHDAARESSRTQNGVFKRPSTIVTLLPPLIIMALLSPLWNSWYVHYTPGVRKSPFNLTRNPTNCTAVVCHGHPYNPCIGFYYVHCRRKCTTDESAWTIQSFPRGIETPR